MRIANIIVLSAAFVSTTACIARGPEDYRTVTRQLVDTRRGDIETCFGGTEGTVVVDFTVEKKTGKITNPKVDSGKSTASAEAGECIAKAIEGLAIDRPDMRDGAARFTWTFTS